jgi:hypothetical protein
MAAGHVLGYWLAGLWGAAPSLTSGHGYLEWLLLLAVPFSVAVLARAFVGGARAGVAPVRFGLLAGAQIVLFVVVEVGEHAAAGIGPSVALPEASLLLGVLGQLVVGGLLSVIVRGAHRAGEFVAASRHRPARLPTRSWLPVASHVRKQAVPLSSLTERGPPVGVCAT